MDIVLNQKIKLSDGSFANIFSKTNNSTDVFYNCHLCRVASLPGDKNLMVHLKGKRHIRNLSTCPDSELFKTPLTELNKTNLMSDSEKSAGSPSTSKKSFTSPFDLNQKSNELIELSYKKEKYRCAIEKATNELLAEHKHHLKTPEDHPDYGEEWKKFWEKRYHQLRKEGKVNPNDYDYKTEWIQYWMERMEVLLSEKIESKKKILRDQFGLPEDYEPQNLKKPQPKVKKHENPSVRVVAYEEISSDDDDSFYDSRRKQRTREFDNFKKSQSMEIDDNEPVTFISVCRLLSALEDELGSLSVKVLDLLAKALAFEKQKPNSADEQLMTLENSVFLETVKEKMKGILMVNALTSAKAAAVKKCIQNIAKLIHQTPIKEEKVVAVVADPVAEAKAKIAAEIAQALKAQGKEDCTPEELEILVEMFIENEEKAVKKPEKEQEKSEAPDFTALDDDDLKILLGNFSELLENEQNEIIKYLAHLEKTEPERVEGLKKFVKIPGETETLEVEDEEDYNFEEAVQNVVANVSQQNSYYLSGTSLTDNLLSFPKNDNNNSWF